MSKKNKIKKMRPNYFICPMCGSIYPRIKNKYYQFHPDIINGDEFKRKITPEDYCPYDHAHLFYISDKRIIQIAYKLSLVEIKCINYSPIRIIKDVGPIYLPTILIEIETELSENGKKNLDKLKKKINDNPKLKNINICEEPVSFQNHEFKNECDENGNITNTFINEYTIEAISIELAKPKKKHASKKCIKKSIKHLSKVLDEIFEEGVDKQEYLEAMTPIKDIQ